MIEWLYHQTLVITVLVALLLLFRRFIRNLAGTAGHYLLWLLIPVTLIINQLPLPTGVSFTSSMAVYAKKLYKPGHQLLEPQTEPLLLIWLFGFVIFALVILVNHLLFISSLKKSKPQERKQSCAGNLAHPDTKPLPRISVSDRIISPFLIGILRFQVIVPTSFFRLTEAQQSLVLEHEWVHYKRHDILWNVVAALILCVFWFNPVLWWGYRRFRFDQELACDVTVLKDKDVSSRKAYLTAMLELAMAKPTHPVAATLFSDKNTIKERIMNISQLKDLQKNKMMALIFGICVIAAVTIIGVNTGGDIMETELSPVHRVAPEYPKIAVEEKLEGTVTLEVKVAVDGTVSEVKVIESTPEEIFDLAAVTAVKQWRYDNPTGKDQTGQLQLQFAL